MAKAVEFAKTLRRHWKKSIFFSGVIAYGSSFVFDRYKTFQMMRAYCEEARTYGEKPIHQMAKPKHITVILNPDANNKKANVQFEKFVAPLLHLAGFKVSVFQTEFEKQASKLMEIMSNTDAVIVAGGNGTLHEVVTGLLNRNADQKEIFPLGVIPLGKTNTVANHLFGSKSFSRAQLMAEAAMAVIRENTTTLDVLKIQFSGAEKPVFGLCSFEQGAFAEVEPLVQKYWYLGIFKDKFTYLRHAFKFSSVIENQSLEYVTPCAGCSKCFIHPQKPEQSYKWWHAFVPRTTDNKASTTPMKDFSQVINPECGELLQLKPFYLNLSVSTAAADSKNKDTPTAMWIKIYPEFLSFTKFISAGLSHQKSKLKDDTKVAKIYEARELTIEVQEKERKDEEKFCYVDDEKYPRTSCKISLLPKHVTVYGKD